ncbi:MAG: hypothetical protein ACT4QC_04775 [Planctomycetaceae bacterium]
MRKTALFVVCGCWIAQTTGCSHLTERRVVQAFAESLRQHDLKKLQQQSSDAFEQKAVHGEDTFDTVKLVDIPDGTLHIVKVVKKQDDDSNSVVERRVVARVGNKKTGQKVQFVLKRDGDSRRWVVDEMYLSSDDLKKGRSLGARLAVLHGLHDSLEAWQSADRDRILATATPEFGQSLAELAPAQLSQFATKVTTDVAHDTGIRPQDRLGEETAELSVPRIDGELVFSFRRLDDAWKLDELKVKSRKGAADIASVRQMSAAMGAAQRFQGAYRAGDKPALQLVCTPRFFNGSLATADLTTVPLPAAADTMDDFNVKLEGTGATFVVPAGGEVLKLTLVRDALEQIHAAPRYRIDDVTIYELQTAQDKRLSALFTAHASLIGFSSAIAARDLGAVRQFATQDFKERVWEGLAAQDWRHLPLNDLEPVPPRIVQTSFKGSLTEVLVEQGNTPLTYVLRDDAGRMLVDDVLLPPTLADDAPAAGSVAAARSESLKARLEIVLPVLAFSSGLEAENMVRVRANASEEFCRLVWQHFENDHPPQFDHDPLPHLYAPVTAIRWLPGEKAELRLGDSRLGARIDLVRERGKYRLEDVTLVSETMPEQQVRLRNSINMRVARRTTSRSNVD